MPEGQQQDVPARIETIHSRSPLRGWLDLQPLWRFAAPEGGDDPPAPPALGDAWGRQHRPDWAARGLIIWPRGAQTRRLRWRLELPAAWRQLGPERAVARLCLRWWAEAVELRVDGERVHAGDLFDTACRWPLPRRCWQGEALELELELRSPRHDDGALIESRLELEPLDPADPDGLLADTIAALAQLRAEQGRPEGPGAGTVQVLGHAHLDLAWLWPVADTWRAAERTFSSTLGLMKRFPQLHFGHSTPALYAWLERQRPALFARIRAAMRAGRWEPLNGPWVESDCVLIDTPSLLRQFQEGQHYSRRAFPEWRHELAWLPDSFGFAAGLPAVAAATGVRWFLTHKLAWNATNPFPHRLFRWRSRCGSELLALMTAPIGTDGDPLAIERHRLGWQRSSGVDDVLWLPGVGDHGGGPTAEMLEQLALWQQQPAAAPQRHGSVRAFLEPLEALAAELPVWRDELYLELHRGCATTRPDQKRHNRTLERLLREAELAQALERAAARDAAPATPASTTPEAAGIDWRPLLFQQFHDILPGTSIPEVFEQAELEWRAARRRARRQRDRALAAGLGPLGSAAGAQAPSGEATGWWVAQLQPLAAQVRCLRLPAGQWSLLAAADSAGERALVSQAAPEGGVWLQLPLAAGVGALGLRRRGSRGAPPPSMPLPLVDSVSIAPAPELGAGHWRLGNGLIQALIGPLGLEQLWDRAGTPQLAGPLEWRRWADRGEFWDAWDIAADYRQHPLPWDWQVGPQWLARGPLCAHGRWRGRCGGSPVRLDLRLLAGSPWLELMVSQQWRQRHELLRLEIPLARPAVRWAADTSGGVIERPAEPRTAREKARWEVPAISWLASVTAAGSGAAGGALEVPGCGPGLAVLLDGPQGISATPQRLGVSLLRAPTWPDPGADNGWQRQRLALLPCLAGWRTAQVGQQARRLREPLWVRPAGLANAGAPSGSGWPGFPALGEDLRLVGLRLAAPGPGDTQAERGTRSAEEGSDGGADLVLSVQNEGPCRRRLTLPPPWLVLERLDGLGQVLPPGDRQPDLLDLAPWQLAFWRLRWGGASVVVQSS